LAAALLAIPAARSRPAAARWTALAAMVAELALAMALWATRAHFHWGGQPGNWLAELDWPWVAAWGIRFHLALDGLSLLMILLTAVLGLASVVISWRQISQRVGLFHLHLMLVLTGVVGVFLAVDLFLFYFFWELMLIPMYFLIELWGHEDSHRAAVKFFLFTQLGGLAMLLGILGLYFAHGAQSGQYTFDLLRLSKTSPAPAAAMLMMLGFFLGFAVKLPAFGLHPWLPDAHTQAPTAGSVILAGLLLKTGAYGLLRFAVPLFGQASREFAPVAMALGVAGILYGAVLAFAQSDLKRLVAYTSVSHLGFVLLGIYSFNALAVQGAIMQMICHGLSTGALFIIAGLIQDRLHTREMTDLGGLWAAAPQMGAAAMFFAMASLGLPGLGNFVGEFLVLLGAYKVNIALAAIATAGLVAATIYSIWLIQRTFHGPLPRKLTMPDLRVQELLVLLVMAVLLLWLGLYPQAVLDTSSATSAYVVADRERATPDARLPIAPQTGGAHVTPGGNAWLEGGRP
jgi:NADH-quinone oxidoreductase subunit M